MSETYAVSELLHYNEEQMWALPKKRLTLTFDNGEVLVTQRLRTIFSWYFWRLHRDFPGCPILPEHHIGNGQFRKNMDMKLAGKILWDVWGHVPNREEDATLVWRISKAVYEILNAIHNMTVTRMTEYVTTVDLDDIADIITHPEIVAIKEHITAVIESKASNGPEEMAQAFKDIMAIVKGDRTSMRRNGIAKMARAGLLDPNQLSQFIGPRGFVMSTSGNMYQEPILSGYSDGLHTLYDSVTESRSASLALYMNKNPLKDAEYFNRRMQLLTAVINSVKGRDCGTKQTIPWLVEEKDVSSLAGKYFVEDGELKLFGKDFHHYVGKMINIRSMTLCQNSDPTTICRHCFGDLALIVPPHTVVGHFLTIEPLARISQRILSTKHVVASTDSLYLDMDGEVKKWFRYDLQNKSSIRLRRQTASNTFLLKFHINEIPGLNSITICDDPAALLPQRISTVSQIAMCHASTDGKQKGEWELFDTIVGGAGSALSSEVIQTIHRNGVSVEGDWVTVRLDDFRDKEVFITPRRSEDMMSYLKVIKYFVFGADTSGEKGECIVSYTSVGQAVAALKRIFDEKISTNLVHAEVFVRACMTIDADARNYNLPIGGQPFKFANAKSIIANRSVSAAFAFQRQREFIKRPSTYLPQTRHRHPLDALTG